MHESEKWKGSCSVVSNTLRSHGLQLTRLLHPWDFPGKSTGVRCHRLLRLNLDYFFLICYLVVVVQLLSCVWLFMTAWTAAHQASLSFTISWSLPKWSPLSWWCHPTISSSVVPFSSCLQFFPTSVSFPMSWLFSSGGQCIGASASVSVLPMNIQGWFPLRLTGLISVQSKWLSRVFFNTTVWKHQFFSTQPSLWSNCLGLS